MVVSVEPRVFRFRRVTHNQPSPPGLFAFLGHQSHPFSSIAGIGITVTDRPIVVITVPAANPETVTGRHF